MASLRLAAILTSMVAMTAPALADESFNFRSPTGNILCYGHCNANGSNASCFIKNIDAKIPPRPSDCDGDWGHEFIISDKLSSGERGCYSDWTYDDNAPVLDYGEKVSAGDVTCTSERSGVTCINSQGHGFEVARLRQDLF